MILNPYIPEEGWEQTGPPRGTRKRLPVWMGDHSVGAPQHYLEEPWPDINPSLYEGPPGHAFTGRAGVRDAGLRHLLPRAVVSEPPPLRNDGVAPPERLQVRSTCLLVASVVSHGPSEVQTPGGLVFGERRQDAN